MYPGKLQIVDILSTADFSEAKRIFEISRRLTDEAHGGKVYLRGLLEISNICGRDCSYCGIRQQHNKIRRYQMNENEIIDVAKSLDRQGYRTILLQSGESKSLDVNNVCNIIRRIKDQTGLIVALSFGEKKYEDYYEFFKAGASRYLLKFETSNTQIYNRCHPDAVGTLDNRLRCLQQLKEIGFEIGTGNLVGLPGQTIENLADDLLLIAKINPAMVSISPLIKYPGITIDSTSDIVVDAILMKKLIALARIMLPTSNITVASATISMFPDNVEDIMEVGANVLMNNVTPVDYKKLYAIYPEKGGHFFSEHQSLIDLVENKLNKKSDLRCTPPRGNHANIY